MDTHLGYSVPHLVVSAAGAGQAGRVYPISPVNDAGQIKLIRANLFLQALTVGDNLIHVEIGWQLSDDAVNWPPSTTQPTFFTVTPVSKEVEGVTSITAFEDISSAMTKKYVRFVLWVKNVNAQQALSTCLAAIRIERRMN